MRRDRLIILLQPYKNRLMPKKELADSIDRFAKTLLDVCGKYPRQKFNVALPGYILESIDPLIASSLRDIAKRGGIEWLCMGYTEPFLSFSPLWLTSENITLGVKVFTELTGEAPMGFVPPFSNWEPSHIDLLNSAGLRYTALSSVLLAKNEIEGAGYRITEHTGSSMAVFPARSYHTHNAPQSIADWARDTFPSAGPDSASRVLTLKYLYPLETDGENQHHKKWLEQISAEIDKRILEFQPLRFKDVLGNTPPTGLHYFPSSFVSSDNEPAMPYFLNHLHCYDQISVMQRKLMDACDSVRELKESKLSAKLKRQLFFAQDINRFLPAEHAGFSSISDRLWTYGKLIDIERELYELRDAEGGVIQLSDFLRNGYKSVILSNRALKIYIDHKNGAQVYALDYRERSYNACAAYNPMVWPTPNVIVPRESRLGFRDKIFTKPFTLDDYRKGAAADCSNFTDSPFEYIFKNSPTGVKALLNCNGGFADGGHDHPLTMDKVFGLEKDGAALVYSYRLGNTSLTDYSLILGIELPLALPGCAHGNTRIVSGKNKFSITGKEPIIINDTAEWEIEDGGAGVQMEFVTQKKINIWLFSPEAPAAGADNPRSNGITLFMSCPIEIEKNSAVTFTGRITFKKIKARGEAHDSL